MITNEQIFEARVLIVDDNEANVVLMAKLLEAAGYQNIRTVLDSREVEKIYSDWQPDAVLLDINMPYLDGFEVMQQLKKIETGTYVPVLVLTANHEHKIRIRALENGAKDFLTKPIDPLETLTRVKNLVEVRLLNKRLQNQTIILEETVQQRTMALQESRLEVITRLGRAAEFRDNETGLHIIRMSRIAQVIAGGMGLESHLVELIYYASPMHDIGKLGIPDYILLKPGKLTPKEWEIMKTHTTIGAELLSNASSELMAEARTIALTHHERWDGTGYPAGLAGEHIPLFGRICAISDVFDALVSERPYKEAWSYEKTIEEINRGSGTQFDPSVVTAFNNVLDDVIKISEKFTEPSFLTH